jgi:tetratricopeptide (TPR) repeat protein
MKPTGISSEQAGFGGVAGACHHFQLDLSCLVDGELADVAAGRAMAHMEACDACRQFFEDVRQQVRMHVDLASPDQLLERYGALARARLGETLDAEELADKLASVFYQVGKAYVLAELDPDYRQRVFSAPVKIEPTRSEGRAFVDGVMASGRGSAAIDWRRARGLLNGKLEKIESSLEKGKRLLAECLAVTPDHEEARIYLAFVAQHEGKTLRAVEEYRRVFRMGVSETNRGHAAAQLALIYAAQDEYKKAIACLRWVTMTGLAELEERFFFVRFNIGMYYAHLRDAERSLAAFRKLLDLHPRRAHEIATFFARSPRLRSQIASQRGFAERLLATCPELFDTRAPDSPDAGPGRNPGAEETLR